MHESNECRRHRASRRARAKTRPMSTTMMTVSLARPVERGRRSAMKGGTRRARRRAREGGCASRTPFGTRATAGGDETGGNASEEAKGVAFERVVAPLVEKTTTLNEGIAKFYDESSEMWERLWSDAGGDGEHMHHGYYARGNRGENGGRIDHARAQVEMIEESLEFAGVKGCARMVDVGCGIGGSSRYAAKKFGCVAEGVTLSPYQAKRANELAVKDGLGDKARYRVADALHMPFEDGSFDFVWSMESGEHMPDKKKFVDELARVCEPGGTIVVVTWCHRALKEGEALEPAEKALLDRICDAYYLPAWCSVDDYERLARDAGMTDIRTDDWSDEVRPFWKGVVSTALTWSGIVGLLKAGPATLRGALVMPLMQTGLATGTIRFNAITMQKPL